MKGSYLVARAANGAGRRVRGADPSHAKAPIGTVSAVLLAAATVPQILRGLEAMRVLRLLTLLAGFMYRYLFVLRREASRSSVAI